MLCAHQKFHCKILRVVTDSALHNILSFPQMWRCLLRNHTAIEVEQRLISNLKKYTMNLSAGSGNYSKFPQCNLTA